MSDWLSLPLSLHVASVCHWCRLPFTPPPAAPISPCPHLATTHKIERIRQRWEAAQLLDGTVTDMAGRKLSQATSNSDAQENGSSRFRRRLSNGLALLSNPLGQRKTTAAQRLASNTSLTQDTPGAKGATTATQKLPSVSTPRLEAIARGSQSSTTLNAPRGSPARNLEPDATPKAVPRSQTTSFIPRPVRSGSDMSVTTSERIVKVETPSALVNARPRNMPSKIPTPSPPLSERGASPRQHIHHNASLQPSPDITRIPPQPPGALDTVLPSRVAIRSRTTPNLVNASNSPKPARMMLERTPGNKRFPATSSTPRRTVLQENIATPRSVPQRNFRAQQRAIKRENIPASSMMDKRRSSGPGVALGQGKQQSSGTPLTARKRTNSNLTQQTPATSKRASTQRIPPSHQEATPVRDSVLITQARLMGPREAPTPTPATLELGPSKTPTASPRKSDCLPRRSLDTPSGLSGFWRSSRANAAASHEVKTYMPPLYWAGRFQSRFDQWRTEAMKAELNPQHHRGDGRLEQCKLNEEKLAACYILAQLRDLCISDEAADSLWEFELKYRKNNKMLGNPEYPIQPPRKQETYMTQKGAFGRAVRKLTPRKSSFVNLLKGKGWNKEEDSENETPGPGRSSSES